MEYQNVDEAARRKACERVKQLAEAIKRIRKKYYLYFNKISDSDKQRYDQLVSEMQSIADENGLEKLSMQLMTDINTQYGNDIPTGDENNGNTGNFLEKLYQKYIAGSKLQAEFTILFAKTGESAYLKRAIQIQNHLKKISEVLEQSGANLQLGIEKAGILSKTFGEKAKESILSICNKGYKETKGSNEWRDLLELLGLSPYLKVEGINNTLHKKTEPLGRS